MKTLLLLLSSVFLCGLVNIDRHRTPSNYCKKGVYKKDTKYIVVYRWHEGMREKKYYSYNISNVELDRKKFNKQKNDRVLEVIEELAKEFPDEYFMVVYVDAYCTEKSIFVTTKDGEIDVNLASKVYNIPSRGWEND